MTDSGTIFNIQRFSIQDGPGIRTLVFFKGCPLRCLWCCNPESQAAGPSLIFNGQKCIGCGKCMEVCPEGAIIPGPDGNIINRPKCSVCGKCAKVCYSGALEIVGETKTVPEVLDEILKDADIYRNSGGGVTLGGGEPSYQPGFAAALLSGCKSLGIHTAIETCGLAPWDSYESVLKHTDLVLFDIKHTNTDKHRVLTGQYNDLILENLKKTVASGKSVIARIPLIPGLNTSEDDIGGLGRLLRQNGIPEAHLLPYHKLGVNKYEKIGLEYSIDEIPAVSDTDLARIKVDLEGLGIKVVTFAH